MPGRNSSRAANLVADEAADELWPSPTPFDRAVADDWDESPAMDDPATARARRLASRALELAPQQKSAKPRAPLQKRLVEGSGSKTNSSRANASRPQTARRKTFDALPDAPPDEPRTLPYEIAGVVSLSAGGWLLFYALRLFLQAHPAKGLLTQIILGALSWGCGLGAIVVPALMCALGILLIARRQSANLRAFGRGASVAFLVFLTGVHLAVPHGHEFSGFEVLRSHGGYLGGALAWTLRRALGEAGAIIALFAFSLVAMLLWTEASLATILGRIVRAFRRSAKRLGQTLRATFEIPPSAFRLPTSKAPRQLEFDDESEAFHAPLQTPIPSRILPDEILRDEKLQAEKVRNDNNRKPSKVQRAAFLPLVDELVPDEELEKVALQPKPETPDPKPDLTPRIEIIDTPPPPSVVDEIQSSIEMTPNELLEAQALASATSGEAPKKVRLLRPRRSFGGGPPMPEYFDDAVRALDPPIVADVAGVEEDIHQGVQSVQETLASFKIDARVTDVKRGPVITRYEVQPAPGVRVASIANLDRDLARSLSAIAIRIEAPVPGKNVVGIEVPNKKVHLVRLRDVLELPEFLSAPSKLSFVLGKDIAGQAKWADLTKMPHLLIAGATNSGKSVCLNSIIASILTRATPEEVKFSLIDPKRVELTLYKDIKHLYHPVVVEPKDAVKALRGAIFEMDRRYKRFAERGVRNIASYNQKLEEGEAPLPYLVIVIDELADLMMTAAAEFEKLICRLAQLARATGIHLIVATQRPSVNVITGVIKANIPARIAFAVASQVDSRTILDSVGAERLIGSGDMLFDSNNGGKAVRIQGAYLSEEEVNRIVEVVKANYADDDLPLDYGMDLNQVEADDIPGGFDDSAPVEKRDALYEDIKEFVARHDEMSASMIQRRFEIGYPRAGRIVDHLEKDGILGPADGPKARKVIGTGR